MSINISYRILESLFLFDNNYKRIVDAISFSVNADGEIELIRDSSWSKQTKWNKEKEPVEFI